MLIHYSYDAQYVDGILDYPFDYHGHKFFDGLKLEVDGAGQRNVRLKMLRQLAEDEPYQALEPYEAYRSSVERIKMEGAG